MVEMSTPTEDGAWIHAIPVVEIGCSECGLVQRGQMNSREVTEAVRKHATEKHRGVWSGRSN